MKILFVTPRLPFPADTGAKIRTFNLLKRIAQSNKVTLLSFRFENDISAIEEFENLKIELYSIKAHDKVKLISFLSQRPVSIEKYELAEMKERLMILLKNNSFDVIHFDHLHMGQYVECINGLPCVVDEHNVESLILQRCAAREVNIFKKIVFNSQAKKMTLFESKLVTKFSKCLVVSEDDKQNLDKLSGGKANIEVVTNGVDTEYFKSRHPERSEGSSSPRFFGLRPQNDDLCEEALVFTGSMDWLPNNDAVIYFCKEILPLIWMKNSKIKFYVVGRNPSKEVLSLGKADSRIIVTGVVEDVRPYIGKSKVFVVPIRIGGGTRLKILEAMAMEKAVISTTLGAEGIKYTERKDIMLADDPQSFADKVIEVLHNDSLLFEMGKAGRNLVCAQYDWKIIGKKLNEVYKEVSNENK